MDDIDRAIAIRGLPWVKWARYCLVFAGICYVIIGFASPLVWYSVPPEARVEPTVQYILIGGIGLTALISLVIGALNFVAARGLVNGRKWAWFLSLVIGAIYAPSACLPLGVVILYGLLREDTRTLFLD